jgi:hypothetical protein
MQTEDKTPSAADGHVCSTDGLGPLPEPYLSAHSSALILGPNVHESLFTADQMRAYAAAAVAKTIEQCKTLCEGIESGYWRQYKDGRYSSHVEGMSDGAGECAAAIGALGPNTKSTSPKGLV